MANFSIFDKDEMIIGENVTPKYLKEQGKAHINFNNVAKYKRRAKNKMILEMKWVLM